MLEEFAELCTIPCEVSSTEPLIPVSSAKSSTRNVTTPIASSPYARHNSGALCATLSNDANQLTRKPCCSKLGFNISASLQSKQARLATSDMMSWQPRQANGKDTPMSDLSVSSAANSEWGSLPHDILSQLFATVQAGTAFTTTCFCGVCKSWSECPTTWRTCPQNAPFRPQRCAHLAHLTMEEQPFGYAEALMISQLPSLRSLCLRQPATFGALSLAVAAPKGYTLPAPCMLTHLTSLSLIETQLPKPELHSLSGISLLTNLQSFSWAGGQRTPSCSGTLSWPAVSLLSSLTYLSVAELICPPLALSLECMQGLKVLDVAGHNCWHMLDSARSVDNITKLICGPAYLKPSIHSPLRRFQSLQHLVFDIKPSKDRICCWETLGVLTWVTELDIQWIWVEVAQDEGHVSLLQALRAMQLTSLQLSFHVSSRFERDATQVLAQLDSLSHLACLHQLTVVCHFRAYVDMQKSVSTLEGSLQAHLKGARVQVTSLVDPIVVLPVAQS